MDVATDGSVKWLSYDELAEAIGINRESARQLTIRKRWGRRKGNDGRARVGVPLSAIPDPSARPSARTDGAPAAVTAAPTSLDTDGEAAALRAKLTELEAALRATIAGLEADLRVRTTELEAERRRCDEIRQERDDWKGQAQLLAKPVAEPPRSWWRRFRRSA